jgi:AhpD family alkylhydroperoxidase
VRPDINNMYGWLRRSAGGPADTSGSTLTRRRYDETDSGAQHRLRCSGWHQGSAACDPIHTDACHIAGSDVDDDIDDHGNGQLRHVPQKERNVMTRLSVSQTAPEGYRAVAGLERYAAGHVEAEIYELIKLRSSQLNGCSFCVDMHGSKMLESGIPFRKINSVAVWRDATWFTERERAALELAEQVTLLPGGVPDDVWDAAAKLFDERELADLLIAIATINVWNRLRVPTESGPEPANL